MQLRPSAMPMFALTVNVEPYGTKTSAPLGRVPVSPVIGIGRVVMRAPLDAFIIDGD